MEKSEEYFYFLLKTTGRVSVHRGWAISTALGTAVWLWVAPQDGCRAVGCRELVQSAHVEMEPTCCPTHFESAPRLL